MLKVRFDQHQTQRLVNTISEAIRGQYQRSGIDPTKDHKNWMGYRTLAQAAFAAILPKLEAGLFDHTQAISEGWGLFDVDGRYQLQRLDIAPAPTFASDAEAIIHVASRAQGGSEYHLEALEMIGSLV